MDKVNPSSQSNSKNRKRKIELVSDDGTETPNKIQKLTLQTDECLSSSESSSEKDLKLDNRSEEIIEEEEKSQNSNDENSLHVEENSGEDSISNKIEDNDQSTLPTTLSDQEKDTMRNETEGADDVISENEIDPIEEEGSIVSDCMSTPEQSCQENDVPQIVEQSTIIINTEPEERSCSPILDLPVKKGNQVSSTNETEFIFQSENEYINEILRLKHQLKDARFSYETDLERLRIELIMSQEDFAEGKNDMGNVTNGPIATHGLNIRAIIQSLSGLNRNLANYIQNANQRP